MNLKLKTVTFGILLSCIFSFGQDSIPKTTEVKEPIESASNTNNSTIVDSLIDGKKVIKTTIKAELDSTSIKNLEDHQLASEIDQKWLEEL